MTLLKSLTLAITLATGGAAFAEPLTLTVETTASTGTLRVAVFGSQEGFAQDRPVVGATAPAGEGNTVLSIDTLEPGTYGVALFHDLNGNEKLDRNLLGAPNEPFGFSNNPKIGFSAPEFDAFKFDFDGSATELNITLNGG